MAEHLERLQQGKSPLYFAARNNNVHELNAITIDLDVGRNADDLTAGQALGAVLDMSLEGQLPLPSLGAFSGRGAYVMWLLREDDGRPPLNNADNQATWRVCVAALWQRTRHLKADRNATRLSNWYKRPGTVDTKTGIQVVYVTFGANNLCNIPRYDLNRLAATLKVHHEVMTVAPVKPEDTPRTLPAPKAGSKTRSRLRNVKVGKGAEPFRARIEEIEWLNAHRQGFHEGCRALAIFYYAQFVRRCWIIHGFDPGKAWKRACDAAFRLNSTFRPPLRHHEVVKALNCRRVYRVRNDTLADVLGVTEAEAMTLGLRCLLPGAMAAARKEARQRRRAIAKAARDAKAAAVDAELVQGLGLTEIARRLRHLGVTRQYVYSRRRKICLKVAGQMTLTPGRAA